MSNPGETHRRLATLAELASGGKVTQRSLAASLGASLGLANKLLRRLEAEKLVKTRAPSEGAPYVLTAAGRAAFDELARAFAAESVALMRKVGAARRAMKKGSERGG